MPRIKKYQVSAVFEIGMSEYDSGLVFMPIAEAQAYFNRGTNVTGIEVFTTDPDHIDQFRKAVLEAAGGRSSWWTGVSATRPSLACSRSNAT